jgi:hypothetical protein
VVAFCGGKTKSIFGETNTPGLIEAIDKHTDKMLDREFKEKLIQRLDSLELEDPKEIIELYNSIE